MVNPRDSLDKAQALVALMPSELKFKLHKRQCQCLLQKLGETFELVERSVVSCNRVPIPVQYEKVFEEFHHLVRKVKTFVEDCCYENENDSVLAAIRVIAHRGRFFQYHVELDWCSFLVSCLEDADLHRTLVCCQRLQSFDWEHKFKSLLFSSVTRNNLAADDGDLKALLESWVAKPGEHQAICWALLRRYGSNIGFDLHILPGNLEVPPISTTFGKPIGSGANGSVHEFKWKETLFAVKFFNIGDVETTINEVEILEHCCHPHIVNLILAYKEDRTQYLMMERLSGDLQFYIKKRQKQGTFPVPILEVVDMISQVCEGMLYLNDPERKVSHRDLKPKNILVKELNPVADLEIPTIELQVADFGVAKERRKTGPGKSSISENTPNCGTVQYRAPEMTGKPGGVKIKGSSMKADIYSFAVTCSFILTGTEPFSDYETRDSMKQAIQGGARPHLPESCPPALTKLLQRCWNSDPAKRPESFSEILTELRKLKVNLLTCAVEGVDQPDPETPEEPTAPFNPGDRRLNILVRGPPESVEDVCSHICGAGRRQTPVAGGVNLRESWNSSPPMCLYVDTKGINRNDFTDIRTFVKVRNEKWNRRKVDTLWCKEVSSCGRRNRSLLFPKSTSRLHMVWFVCRKLSDLPDRLEWPEWTKELCNLPVQILVIDKQRTQGSDKNVQQEFNIIFKHGSRYFPKAQMLKELIVKVDLKDDDLKEKLWRICWDVKTRVEIENAARIIRMIRKQLGPAGITITRGVGGAEMPKEVSLSRSGEFILNFLCTYWDIPQDSLRRVLQSEPSFLLQACGNKISIQPREFVKFCLIVAAIILYNARDNARNPKYECSWNVSSESSLDQLPQTEARECYSSYFGSSTSISDYYDKMSSKDIRLFLQSVFERDPRPVESVDRDSFTSKILKLIYRKKSIPT